LQEWFPVDAQSFIDTIGRTATLIDVYIEPLSGGEYFCADEGCNLTEIIVSYQI